MEKQRFLFTGGSQGIGAALVELARGEGHDVLFTGRNQELIDKVKSNTGAYGIRADVSDGEDNQRTVDSCLEVMGGIDVLINNAGFGYLGDLGQIEMSKMKELFDTNVFGLVDMGNRVVPLLKTQQSGAIIIIASTSGTKGAKGQTVYAGSKWAVRGITQCWQAELRPHGIRVTSICPSEVQTDWMGKTGRNNPNTLYASDIAETIMAALKMPARALWVELAIFANNPWKED